MARGQAERGLELAADRQGRHRGEGQANRKGGVAPRSAQGHLAPCVDPDDRVVARDVNGPVVQQPRVGDGGKAPPGIVVVEADGLVGQVAARHHQQAGRRRRRTGHGLKEEVVQRRVGQEHSDPGVARGHPRRDRRPGALGQEHDGALGAGEPGRLLGIDAGHVVGQVQAGDHDREGLVLPVLAPTQPLHRQVGGGVTREVIAPEPLDGDDGAACQCVLGGHECSIGTLDHAIRLLEPDARTALGARDGLGMETAVGGIVVFLRAGVAQRERAHGGVRSVVGELHRDREPGSAVGAIDEGVAGAAVRRIGHLGQAVVAHGDVGRHEGPHGAVSGALDDAEPDLLRWRASARSRRRRSWPAAARR